MKNKGLDCLALTIAIIGAINWGLIGLFSFDLVAFVFGNMSWFSRIIYALVGIAGLYIITFYMYAGGDARKPKRSRFQSVADGLNKIRRARHCLYSAGFS